VSYRENHVYRLAHTYLLTRASEGNFEAHELLQLNFAEKDGFSLQSLGRLCIILPDDEHTFLDHISKCQNNIFFYFNDSTTLAWDVLNCQISGWKIQGVTDVFEVGHISKRELVPLHL
jgi:hypothetical protein